jgi:hypothetical protein
MPADIEAKLRVLLGEQLKLQVGDVIRDEFSQLRFSQNGQRNKPLRRKIEQSGITPASGLCVVTSEPPGDGKEWDVRMVVVTGQDPTAAFTASSVRGYVGSPSDIGRPYDLVDKDPGAGATPFISSWGEGQLVVPQQQRLIYAAAGATSGTVLFVTIYCYERPLGTTDIGAGLTNDDLRRGQRSQK